MNNEYTTQWFRDKLFENALDLYKEHWHRYGKHDSHRPGPFVESQSFQADFFDNEIVHSAIEKFGDDFYAKMERWIESGELQNYIYEQMRDYASDLAREL